MPMTLRQAADSLRADFADLELFYDIYLQKMSSIRTTVLTARAECEIAPHTGQEILMRLHRAEEHALRAQNDVFRAHDAAARTGRAVMGPEEPYTPYGGGGITATEAAMAAEAQSDTAHPAVPLKVAA